MICIKCKKDAPDAPFCCWCGAEQERKSRKALKRGNGKGTVYRLQGRRSRPWVASKNKIIVGYYAKKSEALDALERLSGKDLTERYNMTFSDVFNEWKAEHYREIGEHGIESYDGAYKVFSPLYNKKFRDLRTADFQAVIDQYKDKSHSTVSKYKQLASQMSEWAMREEICTTNFARFIKLQDAVKKEKEIFTDEDIQKLEKDGSDTAKIVLMLIYTGMRIGELFSLPVADCHDNYVIGGEKTEAGRNRVIPIRKEGRAYFADFKARATGELLLSGYAGQKVPANFRKRDFYALLDKLKIEKKTPHATRHTFASWARDAGVSPEALQKILGHASYNTTANIYVHADADKLIAAIESA